MTRPAVLSEIELAQALESLPNWSLESAKLHRTFRFADFRAAFSWMTAVALTCERLDHHPEWHHRFHTVKVWLRTHQPAGITSLDLELARHMDQLAAAHA